MFDNDDNSTNDHTDLTDSWITCTFIENGQQITDISFI